MLEISSFKNNYDYIRKELGTCSWKLIREFERILPCPEPNILIEVFPKEYLTEQEYISTSIIDIPVVEHINFHSYEDFVIRWGKFKKLKAFL